MGSNTSGTSSGRNLLASNRPGDWDRLLEAIGLPALLVLIHERMSSRLKKWYQPEDVLQEGLLHAWRDRHRMEWQGIRAFRRWFLQVLENRLRDLSDHVGAAKRGDGNVAPSLDVGDGGEEVPRFVAAVTTTPGRRGGSEGTG